MLRGLLDVPTWDSGVTETVVGEVAQVELADDPAQVVVSLTVAVETSGLSRSSRLASAALPHSRR